MLIYWLNFISIILMGILFLNNRNKRFYYVSFIIIVIIQICISALRNRMVGVDTPVYTDRFIPEITIKTLKTIWIEEKDPFFYILIKLIRYLGDSYSIYFTALALIFWSLTAVTIKKYGANIFLSFLVFIAYRFSDFPMNAMRQGVAIAIVFFSFRYIVEKKLILFSITIIVASFFHKSALIFLPAYFFQFININKYWRYLPFIILFFLIAKDFLYNNIFSLLFDVDSNYEVYAIVKDEHGILYYVLYLVSFTICYMFVGRLKNNRKVAILLNLTFIGVLFQTICLVNPLFNRISIYFSQFFALLIPYICFSMGIRSNYSHAFFFWVFFLLSLYILGGPAPGIVPYSFFWQVPK